LNPGRRGGKPATNRLSYGAAQAYSLVGDVDDDNDDDDDDDDDGKEIWRENMDCKQMVRNNLQWRHL
jgi:hypothetical protein